MFGNAPYYWRSIRSMIVAFGSIFSDMTLVKYINGTQEVSRSTVPLMWQGKESYYNRLIDNPRLAKPIQISLPRASFFINNYAYDVTRKLSTYNTVSVPATNGSALQQYQPVPWNFGFELEIYVRNYEDGCQLIEQILPVFTPSYTLTINYIPELGISRNVPLTLNTVQMSNDYEGEGPDAERTLIWTLDFTLQGYLYGPVTTGNVITQANTGIFINTTLGSNGGLPSDVVVDMASGGQGHYQLNEVVYQGANLPDATATGVVSNWNATANVLTIANVSGTFLSNVVIVGASTGANYEVAQTSPDLLVATITVTPAPPGSNAETAFGFDTVINETI